MGKLPVLSGKALVKILLAHGFEHVRQKGSHVSLKKEGPNKTWRTVVPLHKTLARGTLNDILKQTGMTRDDLL